MLNGRVKDNKSIGIRCAFQNEWDSERAYSMDNTDKAFSEFVSIVKSWIPRRSEPANVSRNFWMPDHSCRVCYECDSQFTVFNRRHHCRLCGRIFCGKCTANFVPVTSANPEIAKEECKRIRVCNFCFKEWEQRISQADNATPRRFSSSLSSKCLGGTKSSGTFNKTVPARSYSMVPYHHIPFGPAPHPAQSFQLEADSDKPVIYRSARSADNGETGSRQFGYATNRSDDDDYEYGPLHNSDTPHFQSFDDYAGEDEFNGGDQNCHSNKGHSAEDKINLEGIYSRTLNTEFHADLDANKLDENEPDSSYECNASSSIYDIENEHAEPVDFENNGLLWLPPDPEDEENEQEHILIDDEEDDPPVEWKCNDGSSSGSGEYQTRDRSSEEHTTAMKNVVDGHFRALIAQLLQVENLPLDVCDRGCWLDIVTSLSWEAANFLKPDTRNSGGMDPGGYVKVKCLACGNPSESKVLRGVVCKKTVAHRRMKSRIEKPCFLILGGALEYQRVANMLSCFDTLLQQEMDHLKMAVAKIAAHKPSVLLVEKSVSRFAQDFLLTRDISLVLNVKRPLLERISRCTGAEIVPSIDHLSSPMLGHCDLFNVEKYCEDHGTAAQGGKKIQKNLMLFEGCPKPLGCTVLLRGASIDELKKVKHVVQYGVFAAYHLALETSFLADEGAFLPDFPLETPISVGLPDKPSGMDTVPVLAIPAATEPQGPISADRKRYSVKRSNNSDYILESISGVSLPSFSTHSSNSTPQSSTTKDESITPSGECNEPMSSSFHDQTVAYGTPISIGCLDQAGNGTAIAKNPQTDSIEKQTSYSNTETLFQGCDEMYDYIPSKEEIAISSSDDQSILVSLSTRCVWKGTVCERSQLLRIKYYGYFDKPLGRFLRDHLFDESYRCRSCDMPSEAHVHCYTQRHGSLTISVRKLPDIFLPGERDGKIWMWHRCLMCRRSNGFPPATRRIVMSDAAWGLSFGKFLELSFSNHAAASRVASCGHSLHKDCLRFYGFGRMVACLRYASINVNSVYLPPPKIDFTYELQEWIEKEANEVAERAENLFTEINGALCTIKETLMPNTNTDVPAEFRHHMIELEDLLQNEKADFEDALHKALNKDAIKGEPVIDILEINKLRRQLIFHSYVWDQRLLLASESDNFSKGAPNDFLLRDKEKICSVDKSKDLNLASKSQKDFCCPNSLPVDDKADESLNQGMDAANHPEGLLEPNCINKLSLQVSNVELDSFHETRSKATLYSSVSVNEKTILLESGLVGRRTLSDGQVPALTDLSDTLDAMWTGESGSGPVDGMIQDPSVLMENSPAVPISEGAEERTGPDLTQSFTSTLFSKLGDSAEDFSSRLGLPFVNMYRSLNRSWGNTPRFNDVNEDSSVFRLFLKELERQDGARFLLTAGTNDAVVPVYDDEPTSIISFALGSPDYYIQLSDDRDRIRDGADSSPLVPLDDAGNSLTQSFDETYPDPFRSFTSYEDNILASRGSSVSDPVIYNKAMHARVSFTDESPFGKVKFTVTCYFAKQFDAIRRACCPSELDFVRSLSRCKKWGAQGGKSNVFFAKSLDDRFIVKQVTKTELESFIKFAPAYFKYHTDAITTGCPTCLAKILGIYQVTSKNLKGGKDIRMDVLVMENLLFRRSITRLYDLKGSSRSRYNPDSSGSNKVLLDQNLIESMPTCPIFVGNKAKRSLERAVWNDTAFLASIDVMDYSLLVGVDEEKNELVVGIIDFIRQYTWDKHLETWVKASGILGGPKNVSPTVISPKQYKRRFRKAMSAYFLVVPDQWSPSDDTPDDLKDEISQEDQQGATAEAECQFFSVLEP